MALSFFSHTNPAKHFDIRLDDDYIIFRGSPDEAASAHLKGTLVLCLSEPLTIKYLRLQLVGVCRIGWTVVSGPLSGARKQGKEEVVFEKTWKFRDAGKGKTEILSPDNYEFPFDVILPGSLPESVEGLPDSWVTYRLKAEIGRKYAKDISTRKPLRIIRALDPNTVETINVTSIENVWPDKLEYSFTVPNKAIIFGTHIAVNFRMVPLLKGLALGTISTQLVESLEMTMPADESVPRNSKSSRVIFSHSFEVDNEGDLQILDDEAEGYKFSKTWDLPRTLRKCLQDAETKRIKVKHKLKFKVHLQNPDGHTSELRATLPVFIIISPNFRIDENNNVVGQNPHSASIDHYLNQQAPPMYGDHRFDALYSDLDPNGYFTPNIYSGMTSPFGSQSRNMSAENLAVLPGFQVGDICADTLHSRLADLRTRGSGATSPSPEVLEGPGDELQRRSFYNADQLPSIMSELDLAVSDGSGRSSEEGQFPSGSATPAPRVYEIEDLCRVPSYSTALRSSARTHYDGTLPNYQAATASGRPPPRPPQSTHSRRASRLFGILDTPIRPHFSLHHRSNNDLSTDTERQVRIMQARSRE
ncbi:CreD protein [Uncinocarpus reesii 1704]|uniref:Carbon catabolite repressor D n=1 Tax=Uncinocarpus reesii (strain UAMH 1704) TaxID=336963 RepID=C4JGI6_UNCRE|nr:CreD protein [Uncinocarpus reesii 1704]EEP76328.1 CreD protein [Uncinocarpus reesii 1704]